MIKEYSNETKGEVYAYRFTDEEKKAIARGLLSQVGVVERKIQRVKNHPKNEGQVNYQIKVEQLRRFQGDLEEIIDEFTPMPF